MIKKPKKEVDTAIINSRVNCLDKTPYLKEIHSLYGAKLISFVDFGF